MKRSDARVHVRLAGLSELYEDLPADDRWLAEHERLRLGSIASDSRRMQFLAGHWLLRCVAAETHGGDPVHWQLPQPPQNGPRLLTRAHGEGQSVCMSLAHSGDRIAAAIADFPIGIDIEGRLGGRDLSALAATVFSPEERACLNALSGEHELAAQFRIFWTLKESSGKRAGHGLRRQLTRRQCPAACLADEADSVTWAIDGYCLALAGRAGMSIRAAGVPASAIQSCWRIQTAAS